MTNVVRCRTPKGKYGKVRYPNNNEIKSCERFLRKDIEEVKPKLIICFGDHAINSMLKSKALAGIRSAAKGKVIDKLHGLVFPSHVYNAWVACSFHPGETDRRIDRTDAFNRDLRDILGYLDKPLPPPLTNEGNYEVTDIHDAIELLEAFSKSENPVAFDYEATCISPYDEKAELVAVNLSDSPDEAYIIHVSNPKWSDDDHEWFRAAMKTFLISPVPKVVQNYYMEELWSREHIGVGMNNMVMDTMVTSHVLNCRRGTTSLDFQVFKMTGHYYSDLVDKKKMIEAPLPALCEYGGYDARYTLMLYQEHLVRLAAEGMERVSGFNDFLTTKLDTLANLKERGMLLDLKELDAFDTDCTRRIAEAEENILNSEAANNYKAAYDSDLNVNSTVQLGKLFYELYDVKQKKKSKKGNYSMDGDMLENIHDKTKIGDIRKLIKCIQEGKKPGSLLKKVREWRGLMDPENKLHPTFALNVAETYRSAAFEPNAQNIFKHNEELKKFRRCVIPLPGNIYLEVDYDGAEIRVICMASLDAELLRQINLTTQWAKDHPEGGVNPHDTHYKWAAKIYNKDVYDITKAERSTAKNGFVFPSFYGAVSDSIANKLQLNPEHVMAVQKQFWEELHYVREWQLKTKAAYDQYGYVEGMSGFRRPGPLNIEQIYNTPIQGPAFHLLLDGLERIDTALIVDGFKTVASSETHDSITFDADPDEVEDVMEISEAILISKRFDWQGNVPMGVSWEMGTNLYTMKEI